MSDIKFDYPKDEPAIICTRSFDAPVSLVWKAFTDPQHVIRWWGPQSFAPIKTIDKLELKKGGAWRFICEHKRGGEAIVFYGTYVDIVPEAKLANSFGVEGQFPADEAFPEVHIFEERDGRTYYKSRSLMPNFEARDAVVATGMEKGGRESMEQLGVLVDELAKEVA
ncbi:MAG: SRPBCC domain-containing protein [Devosia sp.]